MVQTATERLLHEMAERAKTRQHRPMRGFAEHEVIIPDGPFEGRHYRCDRQPLTALFFQAVEDPYWNRFVATGPSQSGKTLLASVIPVMYHLFEIGETVIFGLPSMDMAADKWTEDLLPAIERSRFKDLLPRSGAASKGGKSNIRSIQFANGATLRFMSGGGQDKKRAGFTSRVLVITETDGMDESGGASREADKITQLEARTKAYDNRKRIYMECTVSVAEGRTWRELKAGSDSRIAIRCPHCNHFVTPEREHLAGWQDAADVLDAGEKGVFVCPECSVPWSEDDRQTANRNCILAHRGQTVTPDGAVQGDRPRTNTLGFRYTAANNLLMKTATIAQDEWKASRSGNEDNAEKEMCQFVWAKPYAPTTLDLTVIDHNTVMNRVDKEHPHGHCPADTQILTLGTDVGKWLCHWVVVAFRPHATPHVVDYGRLEIPSDTVDEARAIVLGLQGFRDSVLAGGWESPGGKRFINLGLIDARYKPDSVYQFCDESRGVLIPSMGFGSTQKDMKKFVRRGRDQCVAIGEEYQVVRRQDGKGIVVEVNSDHWKSWMHSRLQTPMGQPGAATLFRADEGDDRNRHLSFAKHLVSEKKVEEFVAGKGLITRFIARSRHNHWLDAYALACAAAHAAGARLLGQETVPLPQTSPNPQPPQASPPQPLRRDLSKRPDWFPEPPSNWVSR